VGSYAHSTVHGSPSPAPAERSDIGIDRSLGRTAASKRALKRQRTAAAAHGATHVQLTDSVFLMPAYRVGGTEAALEEAEAYAWRYGHVTVEVGGRRLQVQIVAKGRGTCARCAEPTPVVFATGRSGGLCGDCTRRLVDLG
jgi:hypothetical protein